MNHDAGMIATQKARLAYAAGMGDHADLMHHVLNIVLDPYRLVRRIEASLEPGIMRGNASWAGVFVAPECLNASQRKHETPRRRAEIGADTERPGHVRRGDQLPEAMTLIRSRKPFATNLSTTRGRLCEMGNPT